MPYTYLAMASLIETIWKENIIIHEHLDYKRRSHLGCKLICIIISIVMRLKNKSGMLRMRMRIGGMPQYHGG